MEAIGCSVLTNHQMPSLGFRVNILSPSLLKPPFSPGRTPPPRGSPPPSLHTPSPRGGHRCFSTMGAASRYRQGGDHGGVHPLPRSLSRGSGTLETCWGRSHQPVPTLAGGGGGGTHASGGGGCPHLPANGEDGDLTGTTPRFGDLGPFLLAAAGARGRTLHRVEVLLVPAAEGKLRQEVQPGKKGGGDTISRGSVPP